MKNVKKVLLGVLTVGVLVGGIAGAALAGHNNPNLAANGHPGYAPDYYYPLSAAQPGLTQHVENFPISPYWSFMGRMGGAANGQTKTAQSKRLVPFVS